MRRKQLILKELIYKTSRQAIIEYIIHKNQIINCKDEKDIKKILNNVSESFSKSGDFIFLTEEYEEGIDK